MKKYLPVLLIAVAVLASVAQRRSPSGPVDPIAADALAGSNRAAIAQAYRRHADNTRVQATGTVVKVLADDTRGDRHQRFILRMPSGLTVLVAHNIDIAPRIPALQAGDSVTFNGIYEWNDKGGVVHWTHHDPGGRHAGGWLERGASVYK